MNKISIPLEFMPLEIGRFKIDQNFLIYLLGEPHRIETDSTRTAGGHEWLWTFEKSNELIAYLYRQPYEELNVWTKYNHQEEVLRITRDIFQNIVIEVYDEPHQYK